MLVPISLVGQMLMSCSNRGHTDVRTFRCVLVHGIGLGGSAGIPCGVLVGTVDEVGSCRLYR